MIKVTELLVTEDGECGVNELQFASVSDLTQYEWFQQLMDQGGVETAPTYTDNSGQAIEQDVVEEFKNKIDGKKGVVYSWSVEYDANWWFIEIDDSKSLVDMLTIDHAVVGDDGDIEVDCTNLREIAEAYSKAS